MRVIVAPNAFKGTLTSKDAGQAIARGIKRVIANGEIRIIPVSDGGDGTLDILIESLDGLRRTSFVTGPLGEIVAADWGIIHNGRTMLIEAALAFGLALVPECKRDPRFTTSRGVGDLILSGLDLGFRDFILSIGGSANNDGGTGMLRALGVRFLDSNGEDLDEGGLALQQLEKIDISGLDTRVAECQFHVLSDSSVPLTGPKGVSIMYSPGKGASSETARQLDKALIKYARIVKAQFGYELEGMPCAGSGGGVVGSIRVFLNARIELGYEVILGIINFATIIEGANLVITGEGCLDEQTIYDKAPIGVAKIASHNSIPVLAVCAKLGEGYKKVYQFGITTVVAVTGVDGWLPEEAIATEESITEAVEDCFNYIMRNGVPDLPILPQGYRFHYLPRGATLCRDYIS